MENDKKLLKITFLGTGTSQGIPMIASNHPVCLSEDPKDTRLRSSILISWDKFSYVIAVSYTHLTLPTNREV
mgnify:CR=1 FL=1